MPETTTIPMALVGGGMFGGDVVLRTIEDLERCGLCPYLGRLGLDERARAVAPADFRLVAIGTRTPETAKRLCEEYSQRVPGSAPQPYSGETPWKDIFADHPVKILFVATPDSLHLAPALHALERDAHVMVEKPLTLHLPEADAILAAAKAGNRIVGVDMHKRYDPCSQFIFTELLPEIGKPLYARAVLEEPLEISTDIFKWAATSNPFSYVGVHWTDLFAHYLGAKPLSVHAVGQKELLVNWDKEGGSAPVETFDSMQIAVDYRDGLRVYYVNNWIMPPEFEGSVNQEMELVGTRGKVEFDQQDRGLRATLTGTGSKTFNPHFTRDIPRPGTSAPAYDGYGKDSIVAIVERAIEVEFGLARREDLCGTYPDVESSRSSVGLVEAAARVAEMNREALAQGQGAPVTARFSTSGIEIVNPLGENEWLYRGDPW